MKIDFISSAIILLSTAICSAFCVGGCGTIRGGSSEVIEVGVPKNMEVTVVDSSGWMKRLPGFDREKGIIELDLETGRTLLFEFRTANGSDSVLFPSSLESGYVLPNLLFFPIGSMVDGATNSLYSFDRSYILFRGNYGDADSAELVIRDVTDSIERLKPYHIGGRRYMVGLHVGMKTQYAQSQTHGLHFGYTFGVRLSDMFGLLYTWHAWRLAGICMEVWCRDGSRPRCPHARPPLLPSLPQFVPQLCRTLPRRHHRLVVV